MYNLNVLYVEDDKETQEIYQEVFKNYFTNVDLASNTKETLNKVEQNSYDLIIMDIILAKENGLDLASKVKTLNEKIKIIMLTAYSEKEKLLKAIKLQVDDYLLKPLQRADLTESLFRITKNIKDSHLLELKNNFIFNKKDQKLLYKNKEVTLTKKEILLLNLLSSNTSVYFSNEDILNYIWEENIFDGYSKNNLSKLISRFHLKISDTCNKKIDLIENCYSLGYKLRIN